MENPLSMEVFIGKSLINGPFSSKPCLITGGYQNRKFHGLKNRSNFRQAQSASDKEEMERLRQSAVEAHQDDTDSKVSSIFGRAPISRPGLNGQQFLVFSVDFELTNPGIGYIFWLVWFGTFLCCSIY